MIDALNVYGRWEMASKIDFNFLLAKADKNTNNASKLLEEKKLLTQKSQQKNNQTRTATVSKQSALAFIQQKKEEIRKRTEQEAKELLEKKQKKDQKSVSSAQSSKSTPTTKNVTTKQNNNNSNNKPSHIKKSSSNATPQQNPAKTINEKGKNNKPTSASSTNKPNKVPVTHSKPVINNVKKKTTSSSNAPKPALSYDQILKIAETCHKDKASFKNDNKIEKIINKRPAFTANGVDDYYNKKAFESNTMSASNTSRQLIENSKVKKNTNSVEKIEKTETKFKKPFSVENTKPHNLSKEPAFSKHVTIPSSENTRGMSSWDRIIADMQKKPVKKNLKKIEKTNRELKEDYDDYEEDEYDSEMEDFIDDESDEEESYTNKKKYSKTIQEIFRYDPKRYKAIDEEDIDDMETDYHSQLKEEKRSLKMGILEDLEELKKEAEMEKKRLEKQKKRQQEGDPKQSNIKKLKSNKT